MNNTTTIDEIRKKMDSFMNNPTAELATDLSRNIAYNDKLIAEEKRKFFGELFTNSTYSDKVEAILNMWTVAVMMEHPLVTPQNKIAAARDLLKDYRLNDKELNEWIRFTWIDSPNIPDDLKNFLAADFRNLAKERINENNLKVLFSYQ